MVIDFHKKFEKQYTKLDRKIQNKVDDTLEVFLENPLNPSLKNHSLSGRMKGKRAVSVTSDIRLIFRETNGYALVLMLDVGTHNQVY